MRNIKFRAWSTYADGSRHMMYSDKITPALFFSELEGSPYEEPVMQYTGLKDKNGKEIYEGDIVKRELPHMPTPTDTGIVMYLPPSFFMVDFKWYERASTWENEPWGMWGGHALSESGNVPVGIYTIIGNIYENPELLEGDNK